MGVFRFAIFDCRLPIFDWRWRASIPADVEMARERPIENQQSKIDN